ncbi:MAG: efflux RND transporter periplasmic adaptor subunit [Candidatus Zixiibacteriota bacterium]|nr:MAG: efflux RND transporter periplasmic adaptor subunit [candidate division Zixibacteria bacterium]
MRIFDWHRIVRPTGLMMLTAGIIGCSSGDGGNPHQMGGRFKEFVVERGTFSIVVSATGIVKPIDRIEIKSKASGRIDEMPVEEGDYVQAGALICRLDQTDVQADVDQAQADLDIADAEFRQAQNMHQRRKELFDKDLISQEELDAAQLGLTQARGRVVRSRISLDQAQVRLSETVVPAPIDGVILKKFVEAGQIIASGISNVSGGTPIAAIADMQRVHIEAGIDEIDVGKVRVGQRAAVIADAFPGQLFHGAIIRIAPEARVEQNVTLFDIVVEVENEAGRLKSGMNASVEVTIVEQEDVLLAPAMALSQSHSQSGGRPARSAMVKRDGRFVPQEVEVGMSNFRQAIVTSGLVEGDTIGVVMTSRLKEENDRMEQRIRSSRSFGTSNSRSNSGSR